VAELEVLEMGYRFFSLFLPKKRFGIETRVLWMFLSLSHGEIVLLPFDPLKEQVDK
jgi:hypothetical protein